MTRERNSRDPQDSPPTTSFVWLGCGSFLIAQHPGASASQTATGSSGCHPAQSWPTKVLPQVAAMANSNLQAQPEPSTRETKFELSPRNFKQRKKPHSHAVDLTATSLALILVPMLIVLVNLFCAKANVTSTTTTQTPTTGGSAQKLQHANTTIAAAASLVTLSTAATLPSCGPSCATPRNQTARVSRAVSGVDTGAAPESAALSGSILDSILGLSSTGSSTPTSQRDLKRDHPDLSTNNNNNEAFQMFGDGETHLMRPAGQTADKVTLAGDILLGGLFPIHMKGSKSECGAINRDRGIQRLEAMLYALDRINQDSDLLPDIKLGAILLDSCSSSTYALNQSLEFIRASINTVEASAFECKDKSTPRPKYGSKMIAGVIGGSYSEVSLQVANLLRLFRIPQVSYASTGTALSDKTLYDLFARTVPSDMFQARAIVAILRSLKWQYVSLVSSEGLYGDSGSKEFIKGASEWKICIATHEKIAPTSSESALDGIVANLVKRNATGVVLFTRAEDTRELLLAVKRAKLYNNFAWVAADGWGTHQKLIENVEEVAWGAITVELQAKAIPGFDGYMKALTPWTNQRNPWFDEYWQEWFDCHLKQSLFQQQRFTMSNEMEADDNNSNNYKAPQDDSRRMVDSTGASEPIDLGNDDALSSAGGASLESLRVRRSSGHAAPSKPTAPAAPLNSTTRSPTASKTAADASAQAAAAAATRTKRTPQATAETATLSEFTTNKSPGQMFGDSELMSVGSPPPPNTEKVRQICSANLKINEANGYRQEQKVQFVVDAVYAMAHALHKAWSHLCGAQPGYVCEALKELSGGEFYTNYLLNVSFKDLAGSEVKFDRHGDGLGRYNIYNYRKVTPMKGDGNAAQSMENTSPSGMVERVFTSNNEFEYSTVGRWSEGGYDLSLEDIQFFQGGTSLPESYCSKPCELGQAKIMRAGDHCCWMCKTCLPFEFLPNDSTCQDCGVGRWPEPDKKSCYDLPQKHIRWDSIYSLISLVIACLGIALTIFVTIIFFKYIDTPVVKASGRELSFILLAGIACCHASTFVLLSKPTIFICGGQRFLVNFGFALMYASLLVKTNRISRIFNCARKSAKRPSFISPRSQMLITGILVGIQIFLTIVWFVFEPPGIRADSPEGKRDEVILKCRIKGRSFIISLIYNMILITTCTIYAVKTRKIPENFNESKFIGFTMYTTIVIWLAFVTLFFGTNHSHEIQINTMCVCISLSAYVTLFCLFSPKISIILLHPDKNVRKLTMNSATYKRAFKPVSSVASVDGRNNIPASQMDGVSGGPMSTTSNVINLGESQAARMQESSTGSNVANSNSAGSNFSQKALTSLSNQQSTLVGVCANCGSHQLTSSAPLGKGGGHIQNGQLSGSQAARALDGSQQSGARSQSGDVTAATSSSKMTATVAAASHLKHQHCPAALQAAKSHCRISNLRNCEPNAINIRPLSQSSYLVSQLPAANAPPPPLHLNTQENAANQSGHLARARVLQSKISSHSMHNGSSSLSAHQQTDAKGRQLSRRAPSAESVTANPQQQDYYQCKSSHIERHSQRLYHHQHPQQQHQRPQSSLPYYNAGQRQRSHHINNNRRNHQRDELPLAKDNNATGSLEDPPYDAKVVVSQRGAATSLSHLSDVMYIASNDKQFIGDESLSSLAHNSFANTSQENTPRNIAHVHSNGQIISGSALDVASHHEHHRHFDDNHDAKGSDSMLCNQSIQSLEYCSDCCPSLCHCSCPICSSNGDDDDMMAPVPYRDAQDSALAATLTSCPSKPESYGRFPADNNCALSQLAPSDRSKMSADQIRLMRRRSEGPPQLIAARSAALREMTPRDDDDDSLLRDEPKMDNRFRLKVSEGRKMCKSQTMEMQTIHQMINDSRKTSRDRMVSSPGAATLTMDKDHSMGNTQLKRGEKAAAICSRGDDMITPSDRSGCDPLEVTALQSGARRPTTSRTQDDQIDSMVSVYHRPDTQSSVGSRADSQTKFASDDHRCAHSVGGKSNERRKHWSDSSPPLETSSSGAIRASLEMVKWMDSYRRSVEASEAAKRHKSGCFNYHDDYEYSYGLVGSDSDSESGQFFGDDDGAIYLGASRRLPATRRLDISEQDSVRHCRDSSDKQHKSRSVSSSYQNDDESNNNADDEKSEGVSASCEDDDFEHDGKVLDKPSKRRRSSQRQSGDINKQPQQMSSSSSAAHQQKSSLGTSPPSGNKSTSCGPNRKILPKELDIDEHRVNSVALIAATLSAGGVIVESSGSGGGGTPSASATAAPVEQSNLIEGSGR